MVLLRPRFVYFLVHVRWPLYFARELEDLCLLPLGDSITQGGAPYASWRYPLWKRLRDAEPNLRIGFAGSMTNYHPGDLCSHRALKYKGEDFPWRHEGHWAWRADEILNGRGDAGSSGSGRLEQWMDRYAQDTCSPNCVLIHLGTNDVRRGESNEDVLEDLRRIVSSLQGKFGDGLKILIAMPILSCNSRTASLGQAIQQNFGSAFIHVVDLATDFDATSMLYDGCHPNEVGEEFMAARWFAKIMDVCIVPATANTPQWTSGTNADACITYEDDPASSSVATSYKSMASITLIAMEYLRDR